MTILKEFKALINGNIVPVQQVHTGKSRQSIGYRLTTGQKHGYNYVIDNNKFWNMQPVILN